MGFRRVAATIVSLIIFFIIALSMASVYENDVGPIGVAILAVIVSTALFLYGVSGNKSRQKDEDTKEAITRLETSMGELRKQMDEIHEYIADMYIRYDEEQPRPK